jgi:hypothetical protein
VYVPPWKRYNVTSVDSQELTQIETVTKALQKRYKGLQSVTNSVGNRGKMRWRLVVSFLRRAAIARFAGSLFRRTARSSGVQPGRGSSSARMRSALASALSRRRSPEWCGGLRCAITTRRPRKAVAAALHQPRLVATTQHVPDKLVPMVEPDRAGALEPGHGGHRVGIGGLRHEVKVVAHQAISMRLFTP